MKIKILAALAVLFALSLPPAASAQDCLFDRIVSPSEDAPRIAIGPMFAALREVARGAATIADMKTQIGMSTCEEASLDRVVTSYLGCSTVTQKQEFFRVFEDVLILAEYQVPNWYNSPVSAFLRIDQVCQ